MGLMSFLKKNSASGMILGGMLGFVLTNVLTAKSTEKYLEEKKKLPDNTTWQQDLILFAKCYAAPMVSGTVSAGLIFGGNKQYGKVQAGLVSAYTLLNTKYAKERDAVLKNIGLEELTKIKEDIHEPIINKMKKEPVSQGSILVVVDYHDPDVFIETTMEELSNAEFLLEEKINKDGQVNLSYFLELLSANPTMTSETLGWNSEYLFGMTENCWIEIEHDLVLEEDGSQYYIVKFPIGPIAGYELF